MPVPATHLLGRKNMCRERVSRKWRVNDQLTHSFGRKSLCRGRGGMTVRKMIGFTDGSTSGYGFVRKMIGFYGWEPFRMDLMVTKGDES